MPAGSMQLRSRPIFSVPPFQLVVYHNRLILALNQDKMARQIGEIVKDYEARGGGNPA
jgi:hypothetical protein